LKKVLMIVGGLLGVAVVGVAGAASMQPDTTHVERSIVVDAAAQDVFPLVNDFVAWEKWNPWQDMDPNQKVTMSEATAGVGAWSAWDGEETGKGKQTITESVPNEKIRQKLEFMEPMQSQAEVTFTFAAAGEGTKVTWAYDAQNDFISKAFCLFVDMDGMLGADFDKGLKKMKPMAEAAGKARLEAEAKAAEEAAAAAALAAAPADGAAPPAAP
jgi:hypothetical protein